MNNIQRELVNSLDVVALHFLRTEINADLRSWLGHLPITRRFLLAQRDAIDDALVRKSSEVNRKSSEVN